MTKYNFSEKNEGKNKGPVIGANTKAIPLY